MSEGTVVKEVSDLGAAAYLLMHKYEPSHRTGKSYFFTVKESEAQIIDQLRREYLISEFHRFDSCVMSLKKW